MKDSIFFTIWGGPQKQTIIFRIAWSGKTMTEIIWSQRSNNGGSASDMANENIHSLRSGKTMHKLGMGSLKLELAMLLVFYLDTLLFYFIFCLVSVRWACVTKLSQVGAWAWQKGAMTSLMTPQNRQIWPFKRRLSCPPPNPQEISKEMYPQKIQKLNIYWYSLIYSYI